jgi:hypothetical protein
MQDLYTNPSETKRIANLLAWICKDSFPAIVLRICQDSWGFVGFVKTGQIFGSSGHETNPRFKSLRIGLMNPDSQICEVGFVNHETKTNLFGVRIHDYDTNPWIRETNPHFYKSLIRLPHPYYLIKLAWPKVIQVSGAYCS